MIGRTGFGAEELAEGDRAEAHAALLEEPAAGDVAAVFVEEVFLFGH